MSRVINPNNPGKIRGQLLKSVAAAAREINFSNPDLAEKKDLAAFLLKTLTEIVGTVAQTAEAWEKRDYWIKADKFRYEWEWVDRLRTPLQEIMIAEDWAELTPIADQITTKTSHVKISKKLVISRPWHGAWDAVDLQT